VVHSVNANQRHVTVSCGGAHRDWHYIISSSSSSDADDSRLSLVYIKQRHIAVYTAPLMSYQTVVQVPYQRPLSLSLTFTV